MRIHFKKDGNLRLKAFIHNKYAALSARERIALVGLAAVAAVAFSTYLSAGSPDSGTITANKIAAPGKTQPVVQSQPAANISINEPLDYNVSRPNPFLPPPQYQSKPQRIPPQPENKAAASNINPIPNYTIPNNTQRPGPRAHTAARPVLQGIVEGAGQCKAVIRYETSSAAYAVNDTVGPYQVLDISDNTVTLSGPAGRLVLTLKK